MKLNRKITFFEVTLNVKIKILICVCLREIFLESITFCSSYVFRIRAKSITLLRSIFKNGINKNSEKRTILNLIRENTSF